MKWNEMKWSEPIGNWQSNDRHLLSITSAHHYISTVSANHKHKQVTTLNGQFIIWSMVGGECRSCWSDAIPTPWLDFGENSDSLISCLNINMHFVACWKSQFSMMIHAYDLFVYPFICLSVCLVVCLFYSGHHHHHHHHSTLVATAETATPAKAVAVAE